MKNFRTLNLAVEFYHLAKTLQIRGALKDQLERASSSIVLNLAEGYGRPTKKDQNRFFYIAFASMREVQAIFMLEQLNTTPAWDVLDNLGAHLYRLTRAS